jgi:hypothetical protein
VKITSGNMSHGSYRISCCLTLIKACIGKNRINGENVIRKIFNGFQIAQELDNMGKQTCAPVSANTVETISGCWDIEF